MKVSYARKSLLRDKTRFIISLLGVSFSIILILVVLGIYQGFISGAKRFILNSGADIWVVEEGSVGVSFIPSGLTEKIENIDGVTKASSLVLQRTAIEVKGNDVNLDVVGFNQSTDLGAPENIIEGKRGKLGDSEIIIDRQTAMANDLKIGDKITIEGRDLEIVSITREETTGLARNAYIDYELGQKLFNPRGVTNYILVVTNNNKTDAVISEIEDLQQKVEPFKTTEFADENAQFIIDTFSPILAAIVGIALVIGVSIVGLITYTITLAKQREYAILKAIGASNLTLYSNVFQQASISGLAGFIIGALLSFAVAASLEELIAEISIEQISGHFVLVFIAAIFMSLIASYIPARHIAAVDPATVF